MQLMNDAERLDGLLDADFVLSLEPRAASPAARAEKLRELAMDFTQLAVLLYIDGLTDAARSVLALADEWDAAADSAEQQASAVLS